MGKPQALNGRTATRADADSGSVIFYIPDARSTAYRFDRELPLRARLVGSDENTGFTAGTEIEVLQAELGDSGDVIIGFVIGDEQGVCMLREIELVE